MSDETPIRSSGKTNPGDVDGGHTRQQSPLQGRAPFIKNWDWELIIGLNRGSCERGKAQFGYNRETHEQVRKRWEEYRHRELSLGEVLNFLLECHRRAPFLFFNGNTFGEIARRIMDVVMVEFPLSRRREAASLAAHYVAGVLDHPSMASGIEALVELMDFQKGDRVCTLKKSLCGEVQKILPDGKIVWKPDDQAMELTALPESLIRETKI